MSKKIKAKRIKAKKSRVKKIKVKTRKAIASRFKVTGTGKLMFNKPGRRHILTKKTRKRKRQLKRKGEITTKGIIKSYKRAMQVR